MTAPTTTWPAGWERVYVRGHYQDLGKLVRGEANVGLAGRVDFQVSPSSVVYRTNPGDAGVLVDTSAPFGSTIDPATGLVLYLVPVGDSTKTTPTGFTTRVFDPVLGPYDLLVSKDTPILDNTADPLHGQRVLELGQISPDPFSGGVYVRLPGPRGAGSITPSSTAPGGSNDLSPYFVAATGSLAQSITGLKTFLAGVRLPTTDTDPAAPVRYDDPRNTNPRTPTAHSHDAGNITTGSLAVARLPVGGGASQVAQGDHTHPYAPASHTHATTAITTGTFDIARLPVGDTSAHVARGDNVANLRRKLFGASGGQAAPSCYIYRASDGSAMPDAVNTILTSWTALSDPGGMLSGSTIVIPTLEEGNFLWRVQFTFHFAADADGVRYGYITKNTTSITPTPAQVLKEKGGPANPTGGAGDIIDVLYTGPLNAGDVLRFLVFHNAGNPLLITSAARTSTDTFVSVSMAGAIS